MLPYTNLFHEQFIHLAATVVQSPLVSAINYPYKGVGLLKVVPPIGAQGFLSTDIPYVQRESV